MYLADRQDAVAAPATLGYCADRILEWWGTKRLIHISASACREYAASRARSGVKTGTVRRELGFLQAALNHAHRERVVTNPIQLALPPGSPSRERWLTRAEAARLLWAARPIPHLATFLRIGLETGQRRTAILQLQWEPNDQGGHVDLSRSRINFNAVGRQQTKKRRPIVPISEPLFRHLRFLRGISMTHVVEYDGGPIASVKRSLATACENAGIEPITAHVLRHTAITWACQRGTDPWQITGYYSISMGELERTYLHHHPDFLSGVIKRTRA